VRVLPPHRDPRGVAEYASTAVLRGLRVIICAGSRSASLPGIVAAYTELPVIGVPIRSQDLNGMDALLSIVQQPPGAPVGCMAINGSRNAAIFAAKILAQGSGAPVQPG
jgi:phosphoribosylaminoimidazole carboxylase PurE protein